MSDTRAVPFYCPFCGEEDLYPAEETHGSWHCRHCTRVFALRLLGVAGHDPLDVVRHRIGRHLVAAQLAPEPGGQAEATTQVDLEAFDLVALVI